MVPIREVASWRSYVNIAATTGRSLGGPIGGYLIDTIGWRWFVTSPFSFSLILNTQQVFPRTMSPYDSRRYTRSMEAQTDIHRQLPQSIPTLKTPTNRLSRRNPLINFHHLWTSRSRTWRKTYSVHTSDDSILTGCFTCYRKFVFSRRRILG